MAIQNPNSSGQGVDPLHVYHPLSIIVRSFGYIYSHSTPIVALDGTRYIHHTYKHGEHNVGLNEHAPNIWETSTSCASGHRWQGKGATELIAHLKSKKRRYNLKVTGGLVPCLNSSIPEEK